MLTPDIRDPDWIADRDLLWTPIQRNLSDEFTKVELAVAKEIFFTGNFDLSIPDHKNFFDQTGDAWEFDFYPIQTKSFWEKYFTTTLPELFKVSVRPTPRHLIRFDC